MRKASIVIVCILLINATIMVIPDSAVTRNILIIPDSTLNQTIYEGEKTSLNVSSPFVLEGYITKYELDFDDEPNLTLIPTKQEMSSPIADAGVNQTIHEGQKAFFNVSGSYDTDGYITKYEFDFGDGTNYTWVPTTQVIYGTDILVYVTQAHGGYNRTYFDYDLPQVLVKEGFNVDVIGIDQITEITSGLLDNYDQLWIMSTNYSSPGCFSQMEIDAILSFQENGGGLFIAADHTLGGASAATDANQISTNFGVTFSGHINHGHKEIYPFIVSHPLCENVGSIWGHWSEAEITVTNPNIEVIAVNNGYNMIAVLNEQGEGKIVFDTSFVRMEDGGDPNGHDILKGDNVQYAKNIAKWLGERYVSEIPPLINHTYGDDGLGTDGIYTMTLTVTDNEGGTSIDTSIVTVLNLPPNATIKSATMDVEIRLRVAGRKYNNVSMVLYEEGNIIGQVSIERMPGSPNEQMAWIPITLDMTKTYNATVIYIPEDPPNIGSNPVWVYIKLENGSIEKIHHTFNVQQSKKRNSDHWNHVEPWEVDINNHLIGNELSLEVIATDPGSDDLTFQWNSEIVITYYNNGISPDPYPSPDGIFPFSVEDFIWVPYKGPGLYTLTITDDDNGVTYDTIDLA